MCLPPSHRSSLASWPAALPQSRTLATKASRIFPKWHTTFSLLRSPKWSAALCRSLPRLSSLKRPVSSTACLRDTLVYLLAQLRCSTHCAQCWPTKRIKRNKKRTTQRQCASYPLCLACYSGGRSPSWPWFEASSSHRGEEWSREMNEASESWEGRAFIGDRTLYARVHVYIRCLLFICAFSSTSALYVLSVGETNR